MEVPVVQTRLRRRIIGTIGLALLALGAGCVETKSFLNCFDCPPRGHARQLAMTWKSEVMTSPDPTRNGQANPVLVGRLYLFGESIDYPLGCDGDVVVELFNETPGAEPLLLERWQIDKGTMKRVQHKDIVGWGYNLILPWGTYKPEITQVRLKVAYEAGKGMPVYTENVITVNSVQEYQIGVKTSPGTTTSFTPAAAAQQAKPEAEVKPAPTSVSVGTMPPMMMNMRK